MSRAGDAGEPGTEGQSGLPKQQPCAGCGEETAPGSIFFSDRRTVERPDGPPVHLCVLCDARLRSRGRRRQLTDDEVRILVQSAALLDIAWKRF